MQASERLRWRVSRRHEVQAYALTIPIYLLVGLGGYWGWGAGVAGNVLQSMCVGGCEAGPRMLAGYVLALAVVANLVVTMGINCFVRSGGSEVQGNAEPTSA